MLGRARQIFKPLPTTTRRMTTPQPDIAGLLQISEDTVLQSIPTRKLPAHRLGCIWFKVSEVDAWVRSGNEADSNPQDAR